MTDRNIKLEDLHIDFIRLIMRSPDLGEGWRSVSGTLGKWAENTISKRPEIYESKIKDDVFMLRLSEEGRILANYI